MRRILIVTLMALAPAVVSAQGANVGFLAGAWVCRGGTPRGQAMAARVVFDSTLDGYFLRMDWRDEPPGKFKAMALWHLKSAPGAAEMTPGMTIFDNFGGDRRYAADAWTSDSVVWTRQVADTLTMRDRFVYRRAGGEGFWYGWYVERRPTKAWTLGDSLSCTR